LRLEVNKNDDSIIIHKDHIVEVDNNNMATKGGLYNAVDEHYYLQRRPDEHLHL